MTQEDALRAKSYDHFRRAYRDTQEAKRGTLPKPNSGEYHRLASGYVSVRLWAASHGLEITRTLLCAETNIANPDLAARLVGHVA